MKVIGGYFSLELPRYEEYHAMAIKLNTGRNCLEYILRARKFNKVYIPYYTCNVVLEPFKKLGISYAYYPINFDLEIADDIHLNDGTAILCTNYYGLKQRYIEKLALKYGKQLIVDNTQAFYAKPIEGIDTFYTCRKFFGVTDGAYLYTDAVIEEELEQDVSFERMTFLTKRLDLGAEAGYADFRKQRKLLVGHPIKKMSSLTERMMQGIDYKTVARQRRENFQQLHEALKGTNNLCNNHLKPWLTDDAVPMVYPYLTDLRGLREFLIQNKVFVALYWPNVMEWAAEDATDYQLAKNLLPLPIDQRYDKKDMNRIITIIQECQNY